MELDPVRDTFLGGDPIAGRAALLALLEQGDAGEDFLFSTAIEVPTVQVRRRWLQYVATRPRSTGPRLAARIRDATSPFGDGVRAASLFAGLPLHDPMHGRVNEALRSDFARGTPSIVSADDYWRVASTFAAAGASELAPWQLWHATSRSAYAWEKLRTHAFRAACELAARFGKEHLGLLERFVTRQGTPQDWRDIDASELWLQSYQTFNLWRSGNLIDGIFATWSTHQDKRLRRFGGMILNAIGFRRAQEPLLRWIAVEGEADIRDSLVTALAQCRTTAAADALLGLADKGVVNREALAIGAQYATDRATAILHLEDTADADNTSAAEALVALARMGVASQSLAKALFAADHYRRLNAALAYGILNDRTRVDDLMALQIESSGPMESVYVAAALAMLGCENSAEQLHRQLVQFARRWVDGGELFYLKPALQQAIVTAFERGGPATAPSLEAWKAEFEPLSGVTPPVSTAIKRPKLTQAAVAASANPAVGTPKTTHRKVPERFRVAFSFAGAQRTQVTAVAEALEQRLGRGLVFLDDWYQAYVAGHDADILLQRIYGRNSDLVVMCIAAAYDDRPWTMVEHRALRALSWGAKAGSRQAMRVLPLRFGDGDVEGVLSNTIAPDVRQLAPDEVADLVLARLHLVDP